jgi:hypothetical protein
MDFKLSKNIDNPPWKPYRQPRIEWLKKRSTSHSKRTTRSGLKAPI